MQENSFFSQLGKVSSKDLFLLTHEFSDVLSQLKRIAVCIALNELEKAKHFFDIVKISSGLSEEEEKLLNAIEFRLFSKKNTTHKVFRWQKIYSQIQQDMRYPQNIQKILYNKEVILEDVCPCCATTTQLSVSGQCAPLTVAGTNAWLCPHCLAMREWNYSAVRESLWEYFTNFFNNLPRNNQGLLSTEDAHLVCYFTMALAPLALIRFGYFQTDAIGHFIINPTLYVSMKSRGLMPESLDFLGYSAQYKISNMYLAEKWKDVFALDPAAAQVACLLKGTPFHIKELTRHAPEFYCDADLLTGADTLPPLSFSVREHCQARVEMQKMGIPPNAPFVILHIRDDAYDYEKRPENEHNFKHIQCRNADIDNYQLVAEYLASLGYYVLRTGHCVRKPIAWAQSHIIDYAVHHRSEFMDIWLFSNCDFCISTSSGPTALPSFFNKASIFTDLFAPIDASFFSMGDYLGLPKKYVYPDSMRRVTVAEYAKLVLEDNKNVLQSLIFIENTPQEILEVVKEKLAIRHGEWQPTPLLEALQDRYDAMVFVLAKKRTKNASRGYEKLKKYKNSQRIHCMFSGFLLADYAQECENNGGKIDITLSTLAL